MSKACRGAPGSVTVLLGEGDSDHSFCSLRFEVLQQSKHRVTVRVKSSEDWVLLPIISYKMRQESEFNLRYLFIP